MKSRIMTIANPVCAAACALCLAVVAPGSAGADTPVRLALVEGLVQKYDPFKDIDTGDLTPKAPPPAAAVPAPASPPDSQQPPGKDAAAPDYAPAGDVQTAAIDNAGAVRNGPTKAVTINSNDPLLVHSIRTYHWNNGRGRKPGTIALRNADGQVFGPWPATGLPGQGNVRDAYWLVEPGALLPPGKYEIVDSDPATWATNKAAGGRGFVVLTYQKMAQAGDAPGTTGTGQPAEGSGFMSRTDAFAKAVAILIGDPYGRTEGEVAGNIREQAFHPEGPAGVCQDVGKPTWEFHVVVVTDNKDNFNNGVIDGYLALDAATGEIICANLPLLQ